MTKQELQHFKEHISKALDIGGPASCVYTFLPEDIQEAGLESMTQVFSVISSCIVDESVGRHWPVRSYPWGTSEALSSSHSDVPALKRLLIELSFDDIKACTESSYHSYRKEQLSQAEEKANAAEAEASAAEAAKSAPMTADQLLGALLDGPAGKGEFSTPQVAKGLKTVKEGDAPPPSSADAGKAAGLSRDGEAVTGTPPVVNSGNTPGAPEELPKSKSGPSKHTGSSPQRSRASRNQQYEMEVGLAVFLSLLFFMAVGVSGYLVCKGFGRMNSTMHEALQKAQVSAMNNGCMRGLDLDSLYASLPSRNREVWALIRLTEAMAQHNGLGSVGNCAQERGALAYQASLARAEMAAQEAGGIKGLAADVRSAVRARAERVRAATARLAADAGHRLDRSFHKLAQKMPIRTDKGTLNIDMKAVGRILWRSTIMHMFR